jgi:transcriptional regulator with XRE-family HTH domain
MADRNRLGQQLRELRKAAGRTQEEVAAEIGVSRATVAQLELGNRGLKLSEAQRVASAYRADVRQILEVFPSDAGTGHVITELVGRVSALESVREELEQVAAACRALTELEELTGAHTYATRPPIQALQAPRTPWEGVQQGYSIAREERRRLNLGDAPIRDVDETLAVVGVRATKLSLPDDVASLMIHTPEIGFLVVANEELPVEERRFQYAHAYAHVLFDRHAGSCVCHREDSQALPELRASAFASRYLVPELGLERYLQSLGKDTLARSVGTRLHIYSERKSASLDERRVSVSGRDRRGAAPCGTVEVTLIGGYFGASPLLICHVLCDLGHISRSDLDELARWADEEGTEGARASLDLPAWGPERTAFRTRLLVLATDAMKQGLIPRERFESILDLAEVSPSDRPGLMGEGGAAKGPRRSRRSS